MEEIKCVYCGDNLLPSMNFCPHCGKPIKPGSITSVSEQIKAYLVCLLLPPFGFYYTYKFFKYGGKRGKIVAWVTIVLNIVAIAFLVWSVDYTIKAWNEAVKMLGGLGL